MLLPIHAEITMDYLKWMIILHIAFCVLSHIHALNLTHLPLDKMTAISQMTFSDAFSSMKSFYVRLQFFLGVQLTSTALVKIMACRRIGDKPLSESMLTRLIDAYMRYSEGGDELTVV